MTSSLTDQAGKVRKGEELDLTQLVPWIEQHIPALKGTPNVTQYAGGASNWTYCLNFGDKEMILRHA